jgi:putative membrane protein insertion efficiency factor
MTTLIVWSIRGYQHLIARFLPPVCRFEPSCSRYAEQALGHHGLLRGIPMAIWRVVRCNPLSVGGLDPVVRRRHVGE